MKILLTADLHETDHPSDEYRWGLFPWLAKQANKYEVNLIALLGDLTDAKDRHSEKVVNRMTDCLADLGKVAQVIFDPGNHDGILEGSPFFRFTNYLPNVKCLTEPYMPTKCKERILFLPNSRTFEESYEGFGNFSQFDYVFCHQTFTGARSENGTELRGVPATVFKGVLVFSGDIHVPQKVGLVEYVGAPYRIRFGDCFQPRVLLIDTSPKHSQKNLYFPTIMKFLIEVEGDNPVTLFERKLEQLEVQEKDQVKLRVKLPRSEYADWPRYKNQLTKVARKAKVGLYGPYLIALQESTSPKAKVHPLRSNPNGSPQEILRSYAKRHNLSEATVAAGLSFLEDTSPNKKVTQ